MPSFIVEYRDASERLALEQAIAYVTQLQQVAHNAPSGSVMAACEQMALADGRDLLRSTLAAALQSRIADVEQKGGKPVCVPRRTPDGPRALTHEPC